jgi:acyl dehydratase
MIAVGETLEQVVVDDLKRTQIVMYAGASHDFNPIHTDEPFATKIAGNKSVLAHGMLTMGLVGRILTDRFGHENVRRYRVRFRAPVWPGDTLTATATVTSLELIEGRQVAEFEIAARNADGLEVLSGSATVLTD